MSSFQFWQRYSLPDLVPGSLFAPRCRRFGARGHNGCARTRELTRLSFHTRIQPFPRNACRQSVLQSDVSPLAPMQLSADRVICLSTDAVVASITPSNHRGCCAPQAPTSAVRGVQQTYRRRFLAAKCHPLPTIAVVYCGNDFLSSTRDSRPSISSQCSTSMASPFFHSERPTSAMTRGEGTVPTPSDQSAKRMCQVPPCRAIGFKFDCTRNAEANTL